jgi:ribonuclease D
VYELFNWRQRQAKKVNLPPFKVIGNETLLELARARPHNREEIMAITGITMTVWRRYGQELLSAIRRGEGRLASKALQMKSKRGDNQSPVQSPLPEFLVNSATFLANSATGIGGCFGEYSKLVDALKKWRIATAQERGIHHLAVLPGYALEVIARQKPQNAEAITAIEGVGEKRAKLYAGDILRIISEFSCNL